MKRRPTPKQIAAARANGAKSRGPVTEAGKQASSRNSLKHGLRSKIIVLSSEDKQYYEKFTAEYMDHYDPQNPVERDLVNDIVAARSPPPHYRERLPPNSNPSSPRAARPKCRFAETNPTTQKRR